METTVARRASLEDDLAALENVRGLDAFEALTEEEEMAFRRLIQRLSALATGRLAILREIRELDDRLGLSPKAMLAMRWEIVGDAPVEVETDDEVTTRRQDRRARLVS